MAAWLGGSIVVLADGRRGLALGIAIAAAGLAVLAWAPGGPAAAAVVVVGGAIAAFGRWRSGSPGWSIMPPGSTPRLLLCLATALVALWVAVLVMSGSGRALRFTVLSVAVLMAARVLSGKDATAALTAASVLALVMGVAAGLGGESPGPWPYLACAAVAAGLVLVPPPGPDAA